MAVTLPLFVSEMGAEEIEVKEIPLEKKVDKRLERTGFVMSIESCYNGDIKVDTLSQVTYQFPAGSDGTSDDLNLLLADWSFFDDSDYYPVINIHAVEYDRGNGYFDMSADAKIGYKASDRITLEAKGHFEFRLNHDVQDCGIAYLRYYQNPDVTLDFSNYEFKLTLSE